VIVDPKTGKVDVDAAGVKVAVKPGTNATVSVTKPAAKPAAPVTPKKGNVTVAVTTPALQPAPQNPKPAVAAKNTTTKTVPKVKVVSPIVNVSTNGTLDVKAPFTNVTVKPGHSVSVSAPFTKVVTGVNGTTVSAPVLGTLAIPAPADLLPGGRRLAQVLATGRRMLRGKGRQS